MVKYITLAVLLWASIAQGQNPAMTKEFAKYFIRYTAESESQLSSYLKLFDRGMVEVETFFGKQYDSKFTIRLHPNRASLDRQWQQDWKMPDFKSECWMVASGISSQLDLISPHQWKSESCEHDYKDSLAAKELIIHELVHVFHGQQNASGDFSQVENIDWFVEGLATYASGQLNEKRLADVKAVIANGLVPSTLDNFWTGKLRYGLSGSVVKFIDHKYGRQVLISLLKTQKKADLLAALKIDEPTLLDQWKKFITGENPTN